MPRLRNIIATALVAALMLVAPAAAGAQVDRHRDDGSLGALFVQTNDPDGNAIVAYAREADGSLTQRATYPTRGDGAVAEGAVADPLASQGSLTYDAAHDLLFAVNAGSDTVSVFGVNGTRLHFREKVRTVGSFPVSVAVHGSLVYVLNGGGEGSLRGFELVGRHLSPLTGSFRSLHLGNADPPNFLMSPAQIGFTPDGEQLIVTTKGHQTIVVYRLRSDRPFHPVANAPAGMTPFGFLFDDAGRLVVSEADSGSVSRYVVQADNTLEPVDGPVSSGQIATCWIVAASGFVYTANTGSSTLSGYADGASGGLELLDPSGVTATTDPAPIDMAVAPDDAFLYVETGVGRTIATFAIGTDGALTPAASIAGPDGDVPFEGIAAT